MATIGALDVYLKQLSIYGMCSTAEIFVEITNGQIIRVKSFESRHKDCPPEERRRDLPLVDTTDAFALARFDVPALAAKSPAAPPRGGV